VHQDIRMLRVLSCCAHAIRVTCRLSLSV